MISNSINEDSQICPQCDAAIPADAPGGMCPGCIIDLGLSSQGSPRAGGPHVDPTIDMPKSSNPSSAFIAPSATDLNQLFDHLEIESLLGQGGMGAVYKARQISLDRLVAVKILPPYSGSDPSFQERFQREARALARLTHPNIVMVFEFGQVADMFYFVMEYVDGVNLREAIEAGGLTTHESLKVVPQICEALQYAHDEGIVHRDIKPENIILDSKGRIKIADFGLAKLMENNAINFTLTNTNQVLGTVKYMAPEQIESPNTVDHRSDIYSLGVVFYELLTGELPLGRFDPPSAAAPGNQPLDPVVMRTLEKQPVNRFQQASDVKSAVESVVIEADQLPTHTPAADAHPSVPPQKSMGAQHDNARRGNQRSQTKRLPAVNFQLQKVFAGFGRGKGLLRVDLDTQELILDIEIKDFLGGLFRSEFKQVRIEFDHVLAFNSEFNWYSTPNLEIQTDYFQEFATLPGAENGKIDMTFATKDKKAAIAFCELVNEQLGFATPAPTNEVVQEIPVDLEQVKQKIEKPAKGMFVAGIIDLITAAIALLVSISIAMGANRDLEISPMTAGYGVLLACCGLFEIYLSRSAKALYGYWTVVVGSLIVSIIWMHPGAAIAIPCSIWMLILVYQKTQRRAFRESEQEQHQSPGKRSSVFSDSQMQMDLRSRLSKPIFMLFFGGIVTIVILAGTASTFMDISPRHLARGGNRIPLVLFAISSYGMLSFAGALILRFAPSPFWANAVAKYCKFPVCLVFPVNFLAGRKIERQLANYENENFSRNPYVDKSEEFTNH